MAASAPINRGQGNQAFRSEEANRIIYRGQEVPYNVNGSPTLPPAEPAFLTIDLTDLPAATDPAEPLYELLVPPGVTITFNGLDAISAGVAATGTPTLPYKKNGSANGGIAFAGTVGTSTFSDSTYTAGDLFGLYPPATADATLDRVRISIGVD